MAFFSPWFFLGTLAVAGPLVAHFRRRRVQRRVHFSAVDFLEARPPQVAMQRWEDIGLLLLRILLLALIALAFARPYLKSDSAQTGLSDVERRHLVLLLDTSASMRRGAVFSDSLSKIRSLVAGLSAADTLEIISFDDRPQSRLGSEVWQQTLPSERSALVENVLVGLTPSWRSARLDEALRLAAEGHSGRTGRTRTEVVVLSDFQAGTAISGIRGFDWPEGLSVRLVYSSGVVSEKANTALALHWLPPDWAEGNAEAPFKVQLSPSSQFETDRVKLRLKSTHLIEWLAPIARNRMTTMSVPAAPVESGYICIEGNNDFGDGVWVARIPQKRALVGLSGAGNLAQPNGSKYFLESALGAIGSARIEVCAAPALAADRDAEVALWVLAGLGAPDWIGRMRSAIEKGATGMIILDDTEAAGALSVLSGEVVSVTEAKVEGFAVLGKTDWTHPIFSAFSTPQFADFSSLRFWRYRKIGLPETSKASVLARFEGGDPAVVEFPVGAGRLIAWASGWHSRDGQWVLSSRCVPFLSGCLDYAGGGRRPFIVGVPGESLAVPIETEQLKRNDGLVLNVRGGRAVLEEPGVYTMEPQGGVVVINVARNEKQFESTPVEYFEALGLPILKEGGDVSKLPQSNAAQSRDDVSNYALVARDLELKQSWWRVVLCIVIGLVSIETIWAASLTAHRREVV